MNNIQSVERAFAILEMMDAESDGLGVIELAERTGLKPPTAHNFLRTLVELGYVKRGPGCKYMISETLRWLGWSGSRKQALIRLCRNAAMNLAEKVDEEVVLISRFKFTWQTVMRIDCNRGLVMRSLLPSTRNFYISASGRCLLSVFSDDELDNYIRTFRLPVPGEWPGVETRDELEAALERVRHAPYEIYDVRSDGVGVAALVEVTRDSAPGAIGVSIPASRFYGSHRNAIISALLETKAEIQVRKRAFEQ